MSLVRRYAALADPRAMSLRFKALRGVFLDHQFERSSPLVKLDPALLERIYSEEVVLPPRRYIEQAGGQTVEGLIFMAALTRAVDATEVFEIGTFTGTTTWTLARNMERGRLATLDLPPEANPALELEESDRKVRQLPSVHMYNELPHRAEITQLWGDSATFDYRSWKNKCDLVYIDGAHSEAYVERDTASAFDMISERGVIVWDDYWRQVEGVARVLHRLPRSELSRIPSTRLVVHMTPGARALLESD
ncbi:MAG: class I SAM-dependent methyltransferase [Actinomycetota bacterium]|nr:class I SAM-dependent methyltransferase [Actinomycetota bacterium]